MVASFVKPSKLQLRTTFLCEASAKTGLAVTVTKSKIMSMLNVIGLPTIHKKAAKNILQNGSKLTSFSLLSHFHLDMNSLPTKNSRKKVTSKWK